VLMVLFLKERNWNSTFVRSVLVKHKCNKRSMSKHSLQAKSLLNQPFLLHFC
jgi:hypothetical protein